jgi:hypothetical protein
MQSVAIVAGDDVIAGNLQDIYSNVISPGIMQGFNMSVASNPTQVSISPGVGMTDSGAFIFEDETNVTDSLPIGGGPQNFTILYQYQTTQVFGGLPAALTFQAGLINPDTFQGGLILGWIKNPGTATLNPTDFIPGRRIKLTIPQAKQKNEFVVNFSPFATKWALVSGVALSLTEGWAPSYNAIVSTLANTTAIVQNVVYYMPLFVPSTGLGQLLVELEVPNTANVIVSFLDTDNVEYSPGGGAWTFISTAMERKILSVPQSVALAAGQFAYIKLNMTMQPGSYVKFKTLGFSSYTEPF